MTNKFQRKSKELANNESFGKILVTTSVFSRPALEILTTNGLGVNFMDINRGGQKTSIKFIDGTCLFDPVLFPYTILIYSILLTRNMFGKSINFWCNVIYI